MNRIGRIITYVAGATAVAGVGTYLALSKRGKEKVHNVVGNIANKKVNDAKNVLK